MTDSTPSTALPARPYSLPLMVLAFFLLYIFQGLFFGYIQSISLLLKEHDFSYAQMSMLNLVSMPFYIKCFFSPFLDIYYSRRLGKRMTYISVFSVLSAGCYLFIASRVNSWIDQRQVSTLSTTLILTTFIIAIQDLAIDALAEEIFVRRDVKFGPITQSLGQIVGPLVSFNFFLFMNSRIPDLNIKFLWALSIFTVLTTFALSFYIKERPSPNEFDSVLDIAKALPKFLQNRHIRKYLVFELSSSIPVMFFRNSSSLILLERGLSKEDISLLSLPTMVSAFVFSFLAGRLKLTINNTHRTLRLTYLMNLVNMGLGIWVILGFDPESNYRSTINWLYLLSVLEGVNYTTFVIRSNYSNLICDNRLSCTFLAVMASLSNFSRLSLTPLFTLLLGWFDIRSLFLFFFSYAVFYLAFIFKKFIRFFGAATKDDFRLAGLETKTDKAKQE